MSDTEHEAPVEPAAAAGEPRFSRPQISPPKALVVDDNTTVAAENWRIWKQMWDNYVIISGLTSQSAEYKTAFFLHSIGSDAIRIYNGMKFGDGENKQNVDDVIRKFDIHFLGETVEFFERFKFNKRNQETNETIDQYVAILRNMSKTCGMCDCMREKLIMDRILIGVREEAMRERCISHRDLDLNKTIDTCRAMEVATFQLKSMRGEQINKVKHKPKGLGSRKPATHNHSGKYHENKYGRASDAKLCKFCNRMHVMKKEVCPAYGKLRCMWKEKPL